MKDKNKKRQKDEKYLKKKKCEEKFIRKCEIYLCMCQHSEMFFTLSQN